MRYYLTLTNKNIIMSERLFTIANVYDYKGGELSMNTNLSKEQVGCEFAENIHYDLPEELLTKEASKEAIAEFLFSNEGVFETSTYAGGDGFCGEIYEHVNNKLEEVYIDTFYEEIAIQCVKWNNESDS